jgi:hypothetical protein
MRMPTPPAGLVRKLVDFGNSGKKFEKTKQTLALAAS